MGYSKKNKSVFFFVGGGGVGCLFVWGLSHSRIFHSYGDVTIVGEGLQIWTYPRQSSSEGSLACHAYCDTGNPFIMVISEDRHTHIY